MTQKKNEFDFEKDLQQANKIEDLQERILFLKKRLKEFNQDKAGGWDIEMGDKEKYNEEIKYVQELINSQPQQTKGTQIKQTPVKPIEKIWWMRSGRLLGELLEQLEKHKFINCNGEINKLIKEHFKDKDKNNFTDSITQNRSGAVSNKGTSKNTANKPKGHDEIDTIIQNLKQDTE